MKIQLPEEKDLTKEKKKQSPSATYIQLMLETEKELYTDCEAIMYGITVACLKFGVESEIECLFSQFEAKVGPRRNAKEDTISPPGRQDSRNCLRSSFQRQKRGLYHKNKHIY